VDYIHIYILKFNLLDVGKIVICIYIWDFLTFFCESSKKGVIWVVFGAEVAKVSKNFPRKCSPELDFFNF